MISMQAGHGYQSAQEHAFWKQWYHRYLHDVLSLNDLHFVGEQLYRDRQACAVYGYAPDHAYARGIRLAGRTVLEYCLDAHAQVIAAQVHGYLQRQGLARSAAVVDLFAGSGNLLHHIATRLRADQGFGFDIDPLVTKLTMRNLSLVASPWQVRCGSWDDFDPSAIRGAIQTVVMIVDPPWGSGYTSDGLDLRATEPAVPHILAALTSRLRHPTVWVIKTFEITLPASLATIVEWFTDYEYGTLNTTAPGTNVGYLLGTTVAAW
jgi:16S rRNA G966 N2-methylase RsmD